MSSVLSRYPLISNTTLCFLKYIYPHFSMSFPRKRLVRFFDFHHVFTLFSISCTYTPCNVCAHIYMYGEILIHILPRSIYISISLTLVLNTTCAPFCVYMYLMWFVHIYPHSIVTPSAVCDYTLFLPLTIASE